MFHLEILRHSNYLHTILVNNVKLYKSQIYAVLNFLHCSMASPEQDDFNLDREVNLIEIKLD